MNVATPSHNIPARGIPLGYARTPLFSVLVPLADHRHHFVRCLLAWCRKQTLSASDYEVLVIAPRRMPERDLGTVRKLLRPHDRLLVADNAHDIALLAFGASNARGDLLFTTESHVWPESTVLEAARSEMIQHPNWAALTCRLNPYPIGPIGEVEAAMYTSDFDHGSRVLRWRAILDIGFCTRRDPYLRCGGFDPNLGHFSEWELSARYAAEGLQVGYMARAGLWHLYPGRLPALRAFTNDFVRGEARYFALWEESDCGLLASPFEWQCRGDRRPVLARALLRHEPRLGRRVRLLLTALLGSWPDRLSTVVAERCHALHVVLSAQFAPGRVRDAFYAWMRAFTHGARLRWADAMPASARPGHLGEAWTASYSGGGAAAGMHEREIHDGIAFRWSKCSAAIELVLEPGEYDVWIRTLATGLLPAPANAQFYLDGKPVGRHAVGRAGDTLHLSVEVKRTGSILSWTCDRFMVDDSRELGIPVAAIYAYPALRADVPHQAEVALRIGPEGD